MFKESKRPFEKIFMQALDNELYLLYNNSRNCLEKTLHIHLSLQSGPIYEQIEYQIRAQIFSGELKAGEALPSIRMLAKELRIGIITAKRAYDDLIAEGFLYALPGKGVFVAKRREDDLMSGKLERLRERLIAAKRFAEENGVSSDQFQMVLREIMEETDERS